MDLKSKKGITMISLIIYVIGMTAVVGMMATVTVFFYNNINAEESHLDAFREFTKFNSYFTKEVNIPGNSVGACDNVLDGQNKKVSYIAFVRGRQFTYLEANKCIYINKIKLCENVDECVFTYDEGTKTATVYINILGYEKTVAFTVK